MLQSLLNTKFYGSETLFSYDSHTVYTEGIQYLMDNLPCGKELINYILAVCTDSKEIFQLVTIYGESNKARVAITDDNDNIIRRFVMNIDDFPCETITLYFKRDNKIATLLLPTEY